MRTFGIFILVAISSCSFWETIDDLDVQLENPSTREQAIHALLIKVNNAPENKKKALIERTTYALMKAYRTDSHRNQLVAALAHLKHPRAKKVFVAALKDADRKGLYLETAIQSAKALGEIGQKDATPALIAALEKERSNKQSTSFLLQRTIVETLNRLEDPRAADILIDVLKTKPLEQDFYLNKLAARGLGKLRVQKAIPLLIAALGKNEHGILLYEEARRALCSIGQIAVPELLKVATNSTGKTSRNAASAVRMLADLGDVFNISEIIDSTTTQTPISFQLALAETLLRLNIPRGIDIILDIFKNPKATLILRQQAADLLGLYGNHSHAPILLQLCKGNIRDRAENKLLCSTAMLAFSRLADRDAFESFNSIVQNKKFPLSLSFIKNLSPRFALIQKCKHVKSCYEKGLDSDNWRTQERAILYLGQKKFNDTAQLLANHYPKAHYQVKNAILLSLEHMTIPSNIRREISQKLLENIYGKKEHETSMEEIESRAICLSYRLEQQGNLQ